MAVPAERLPIETHHSISPEVVPPPPIGGEGLTLPTVPIGTKDTQNPQENEKIMVHPPVGTVLYELPHLTRYLNTPLEQKVLEHDDGTFTVEDGPTFFDEIETEEARIKKNAAEIDLRLWADTQREFPNITIPQEVIEKIDRWNNEHPKKPIRVERRTHSIPDNKVIFSREEQVAYAADD